MCCIVSSHVLKSPSMKKGTHPKKDMVIFKDTSTGVEFLVPSTIPSKEKAVYSGDKKEYPIVSIEISSASHPFYTGKQDSLLDATGRVEKFKQKIAKAKTVK